MTDPKSSRIWIGGFLLGAYWTIRGIAEVPNFLKKRREGKEFEQFVNIMQDAERRHVDRAIQQVEQARITAVQFARTAAKVLAYAIASNPTSGPKEMLFATRVAWELFGEMLDPRELDKILREDSKEGNWNLGLELVCDELRAISNEDERRALLSIVARMLFVDGKVTDQEKKYFTTLGKLLDMKSIELLQIYEFAKAAYLHSDDSLEGRRSQAARILGVSTNASREEVTKAYARLALKYHPDRTAHLGPKVQAEGKKEFIRVTEARDLLLAS